MTIQNRKWKRLFTILHVKKISVFLGRIVNVCRIRLKNVLNDKITQKSKMNSKVDKVP
jgi:hypothetical protein